MRCAVIEKTKDGKEVVFWVGGGGFGNYLKILPKSEPFECRERVMASGGGREGSSHVFVWR